MAEAAADAAARRETQLSEADGGDRDALAALDTARSAAEQRVAAIEADDPAAQGERIRDGLDALRRMASAHGAWQIAAQDATRAAADHAAAEATRVAATGRRGVAAVEAARASAALDAMTVAADRAEPAVSAPATELRGHLADGEPCPVCGATEHPITVDPALAAVFAELRDQRGREQVARDAARTAVHEADGAITTAELRRDIAAGDARKAGERQTEASAADDKANAVASGVSDIRASIAEVIDLDARIGSLTARQADVMAALGELRGFRLTIEDAHKQAAALRSALDGRATQRAAFAATAAHQRGAAQLAPGRPPQRGRDRVSGR